MAVFHTIMSNKDDFSKLDRFLFRSTLILLFSINEAKETSQRHLSHHDEFNVGVDVWLKAHYVVLWKK